jgi:hypothetical protein
MMPAQLTTASFATYPSQAHSFALQYLDVLQKLPLPLATTMLREIVFYDWQFPAERRNLESQFVWLRARSDAERQEILHGFAQLSLPAEITSQDWVTRPQQFSQVMAAYLWSTHQIDAFHVAASNYALAWRAAVSDPAPALPQLCIVVLGSGVKAANYSLFRKLRPHGVFYSQVDPMGGMQSIRDVISQRAAKLPARYEHWHIDGGNAEDWNVPGLTRMSWQELEPLRKAILQRMQTVVVSPDGGPEKLKSFLADTTLDEVGATPGKDEVLSRFAVSILTGGSGTQIYSTTFAQWTAREVLRRAQPSTLLVRFAPRQEQVSIDELLDHAASHNSLDSEGSLVDADMGTFYTWINQQRLTGATQTSFVAWSQEHNQAMAIGPGLPRGTVAANSITVTQLLERS